MNNLKDIHIKCGLSLEKDNQIFTLKHYSHTIARYPANGIISVYEIHRDADDYIAKEVNRVNGPRYEEVTKYYGRR